MPRATTSGSGRHKPLTVDTDKIHADTLTHLARGGLETTIARMTRDITFVTGDYKTALKRELDWLKKRQREEAALARHNTRAAMQPGQPVMARRRVKVKPFDPEEGRYRAARPMTGAADNQIPGHEGYPKDARPDCPQCGVVPAMYLKYGRYICAVDRLARKGVGCGQRWSGPMNASEQRRLEERRRMGYGTEPPEAHITESIYPGKGYPEPPKEFVADDTRGHQRRD